ncbi:MAG: hypothetical protein JWO08_3206 [Verrucomicrobiaceae bacterium]|nr:hypothetical protein [Verrucomicrobiaceae bacterium]
MAGPAFAATPQGKVRFNRDIRPLLSENCYYCHGPDPKHREAKLRLDDRAAALASEAFVPGKPDDSELIKRIYTTDEDDLMPPTKTHKALTLEQKELFKRWIAEGAEYEAHWAYTPLVRPAPSKKDGNPIDAFVGDALAAKNIQPSPPADARTLIRRLSLDLTGLPPTPAEAEDFAKAHAADPAAAVQHLTDRLMQSPRFGERWAVWWLDVARFADTVGFHGDQIQRIFPYRDYVINAFNTNKRFDQFTVEQLAGDLLPHPTTEQLVATGFNRLNMVTREGGAQPKEYLAKYGAERVRTVAGTWLGATFTCCECHDHKYDPISQKDFYAMQAFFADVKQWGVYSSYGYTKVPELEGFTNEYPFPPEIVVDSPYLKQRIAKLRNDQKALVAATPIADKTAFQAWRTNSRAFIKAHSTGWLIPKPQVSVAETTPAKGKAGKAAAKAAKAPSVTSAAPAEAPAFQVLDDGRIVFENKPADKTTIRLPLSAGQVASVKIELLPDAKHNGSIVRGGKQVSASLKITAAIERGTAKPAAVAFRHAEANLSAPRYKDGEEVIGIQSMWMTSAKQSNEAHTSLWWLDTPQAVKEGDALTLVIDGNTAGCIRVSISPFAPPTLDSSKDWFTKLGKMLNEETYLTSTGWNAEALKAYKKLGIEILECRDGKAHTLVTQAVSEPLTVRVLARGNWQDETGEIVSPATPHFLPAPERTNETRATRLDLAKWICSPQNPTTPRAIMNRVWKQFFGNGLSNVLDDLGAQGEMPSHPELLDWLGCEFRDSGWDLQHMMRLIISSRTYQQGSSLRPELRDIDPNNRLLASQNPRRLDAEFVRDNALAIAGRLNLDLGGPSAKPYQPEDYYTNLQFPSRDYIADNDDRQWRRGVYMHWQRTFLHPMLANFDAPNRDECTCNRTVSNTPQQALTLLNDPTFVEAARLLAQRVMNECKGNDAERLNHAYELSLGRKPKDKERESLLGFLKTQRQQFSDGSSDPDKLLHVGLAPELSDDPNELAAWTSLMRVVLNLHETITRY